MTNKPMNNISETKQLLALKFGAILTLDQVAPFFGCSSSKSILAMYNRGEFPFPIITLRRPGAKYLSKAVTVEHLADYIDDMKKIDERIFKSDQAAFYS